jgi:hypothetical protein
VQTLTSTLQAAQSSYDVLPVVSVLVSDNPPEAPRLNELASQYAGTEPDSVFDAAWVSTGQIARARLTGGTVYAQVVTPGSGSWSSWVTLDTGASAYAGTAPLAVRGSQDGSGQVHVFWAKADGSTIVYSYWNGSAWSAAATVYATGQLVGGIGSDGMDSTIRVIWANSGGQLWETHWTGSAWSAPIGDGRTWNTPTIGVGYRPTTAPLGDGNTFVVVGGGNPSQLQEVEFNVSGAAWIGGSPAVLLTAGTSSGYSYVYPKLSETRADCLRQAIGYSLVAPAPLNTNPMICFTPTHVWLTGMVPWRYGGSYGVKVFKDTFAAPSWWVLNANQVYSCPADTGSTTTGQRVTLDQTVLEAIRIEQAGVNKPATAEVTFLNEGGAYKDAGQAGPHRALRTWSQVCISLGYRTSAGAEVVRQVPMWIDAITFHDEVAAGVPRITLHLVDGWALLDELRSDLAYTYTAEGADLIAKHIWWLVCGDLTTATQPRLSGITLATFTIRAGETFGDALRRLLDLAGCALVFRTFASSADGTGWDSVQALPVPWVPAGSSPVYSYGPTTGWHPIIQSELAAMAAPSAMSMEVDGATTTSLTRNWGPIWLQWREITESLVDKTLDTQAKTDDVAGNMVGWLGPETVAGSIEVLANVAQEIGDPIFVTIPTAPVSSLLCTVDEIVTVWTAEDGLIRQTLGVSGSNG